MSSELVPLTLVEDQRLSTSGARAVASYVIDQVRYLAIPQLAEDVTGKPANMNGGNSDVDVLIYRRKGESFEESSRIPSHGGEDTEPFTIDGRHYLAVASIRSGHDPYDYQCGCRIYRWGAGTFEPFQEFPSFAAKQFRYFQFQGRHFLGLAQGVSAAVEPGDPSSVLYEWSGTQFVEFQRFPSEWAYNWEFFELGGQAYLALVDHIHGSSLYRWDGKTFQLFQTVDGAGARAVRYYTMDDRAYLACANLTGPSQLLRWTTDRFEVVQTFEGEGGREFHFMEESGTIYLVRINFITGTREDPQPVQQSQVYQWTGGKFEVVNTFSTFGGTDVTNFTDGGTLYLAVSNSLSEETRFRVDSLIYRVERG